MISTISEDATLGKRRVEEEEQMVEDRPVKQSLKTIRLAKQTEEVKELIKIYKVVDGVAPVDEFVNNRNKFKVCQMFGKTYSKVLNQSDLIDNKNKFYILQMLENVESQEVFVYFRWGRIGVKGSDSLIPFGRNLGAAIAEFEAKYNDKAVEGNYEEVQIMFDDEVSVEEQERELIESIKSSNIGKGVAKLMKDIFCLRMFDSQIKEIGYDVKKMPLGKLAPTNIKMGYNILKALLKEIDSKNKDWKNKVETMGSKFYSFIPHNVGFKNMATLVLDTKEKVESKLELIEMLSNMKIAKGLIDKDQTGLNKIDDLYTGLRNKIKLIEQESDEFSLVNKYLQSTLVPHDINLKVELMDLFEVEREGEEDKFRKEIGNRKLLWHGSRMSNFAGILSQGLKIAPAEAPITGYKFGKGVYFTDMSGKAIKYCHSDKSDGIGLLLLSDVALGNQNCLTNQDINASSLPEGKNSTFGRGTFGPLENHAIDSGMGYRIPLGPCAKTDASNSSLDHNEYVVYNTNQIKMKYLLKCRFI